MKLTFLGTASAMPDVGRHPSALLLEAAKHSVLFEAGEGTARQMLRYGFDADRIDSVFISHTHPDHAAGLPGLLQWMWLCGRTKPLSVFLPAGILRRFKSVIPAFLLNQGEKPFKFHLFPISAGTVVEEETFNIEAVPNSHLAPGLTLEEQVKKGLDSHSFCVHEIPDRKVVYTSDVDGLDHLGAVAPMANALVSECAHIATGVVLDFARQNRIGRVVFTHIPAGMKPPEDSEPGPEGEPGVTFARDGMAFEV